MTPKEKAMDLRFNCWRFTDIRSDESTKSALFVVNEILKVAFYAGDEIYNYYLDVKIELEKFEKL